MENHRVKRLVSIIIPAYNEEKIIGETLITLLKECSIENVSFEIIVVDDGSTDQTAVIAKKMGVHVVRLAKNVGKGDSLKEGLKKSTGDTIVFLDADVGSSSKEVVKIITPILNDRADVVIARFGKAKRKGGFGIVKKISLYGTKLLTGQYIQSVLSGQRAFKAEIAKKLRIEKGFGAEVGMTIDLVRMGCRIHECDVNMHHDETGRNLKGFLHRGRQLLDISFTLLKKIWQ